MKTINRILATAVAAAGLVAAAMPAYAKLFCRRSGAPGADLTPVGARRAPTRTARSRPGAAASARRRGLGRQQGLHGPVRERQAEVRDRQGEHGAVPRAAWRRARSALLEKNDAFKMPVYETRRTACYPDAVYQEVKAKSRRSTCRVSASRGRAAVPFRSRRAALEVMNHQQRYLGGGLDREYHSFPVRANGDYYRIGAREFRIFANLDQPQDNLLLVFRRVHGAGDARGTVFLVQEPLDQVKQTRAAWIYNAGQRRVRRAPDLAYDNFDGTEGMRTWTSSTRGTARRTATTGS